MNRGLLSKDQYSYFISQIDDNISITNRPQVMSRLAETITKCFDSFEVILKSKKITQEEKDELFNAMRINFFLSKLTEDNPDNTNAQEINKQEIIVDLIQKVFTYYSSRYSGHKVIIKEIDKFKELAQDLKDTAEEERREDDASIMYRTRGKMPNPPILMPEQNNWIAECIFCLQWSAIGNKLESIKHIRHTKNCSWHKEWKRFAKTDQVRVIEQYIKLIPPMNS